jgi:putative ABC transport system ATP-binding protein
MTTGTQPPRSGRTDERPETEDADPAIQLRGVRFVYPGSGFELRVPELRVERGRRCAFFGPSGCGKSTLLDLVAGVRRASAGEVRVEGRDLSGLDDAARRAFRIRCVGFVFQDFPLVDYLTVEENVLYPYRVSRALRLSPAVRERAAALLEGLELLDKRRSPSRALSQGERQRVAVARALVTEPALLLADEPTAGLDARRRDEVLELLLGFAGNGARTLVVVTHDPVVLERLEQRVAVEDFAVGEPARAS